jgi:hypothetical protein
LYGTNVETSDLDIKAIHIPDPAEILLGRSPKSKQTPSLYSEPVDPDCDFESMSLAHFGRLLSDQQPIAIEMLFAPSWAFIHWTHKWERFRTRRDLFLSKNVGKFVSYARSQATKFVVKGDRINAVSEVLKDLNQRKAVYGHLAPLGTVSAYIVERNPLIECVDITLDTGKVIPHLSVCGRKVPFTISIGNAIDVYQKLMDQYGKRTLEAQTKEGIDWKGMMHAVRLTQECIELLQTREIIFPRPNADYLLNIRKGLVDQFEIMEEIELAVEEIELYTTRTTLPEVPNIDLIEALVMEEYYEEIKDYMES